MNATAMVRVMQLRAPQVSRHAQADGNEEAAQ